MYQFINVGNRTTYVFPAELTSGITYYTTVRVYDDSSLTAESTSDGVIVDRAKPQVGVVLDGRGTNGVDISYQSDTQQISTQWKNFIDKETGKLFLLLL